jgi:zinc protease
VTERVGDSAWQDRCIATHRCTTLVRTRADLAKPGGFGTLARPGSEEVRSMFRHRGNRLLGAIFAVAATGALAASNAPGAPAIPKIAFQKYRLANGLEVILSEDHRLPLVAVNVWYHVGPADERPGRTGFAHLFEHMMFEGSGHVSRGAHDRLLEGAGATDMNGTTDFDRTDYFETLPSNQLELALWLESDRMGFLLDALDQQKLTNQKDVVRNERRQSIENRAYGLVSEEIYHQLFPAGHPYHAAVMGSHADIEAARLADVRTFFRQYYVPNNATLAIVGDLDVARTKALIEKYFGSLARGAPVTHTPVKTPTLTHERRVTVHDQVELPRLYLAWHTAPFYRPGDAEADLMALVLGGGKSSRLYRDLVHDRRIAQDVSADQESMQLGSVFTIEATAKPGVTLEQLEKAVDAQLAELAARGPTQAELDRARNTIDARTIRGLERLGGIADRLNQYNHYVGDPGYLATDLGRYGRVTPETLRRFAAQTFTANSRLVVLGEPGAKAIEDVPKSADSADHAAAQAAAAERTTPTPAEDWRETPPAAGPPSPLALPLAERFTLGNGLSIFLLQQHRLPVVAADLVVLSGSEANPLDRPGLAEFTAAMLQEGTERRSAQQIADDAAQIGADLESGSARDASSIEVHTLTGTVDTAFELLADVALHPAFAPAELDRMRDQRLTRLRQQHDNPNATAARVLALAVYGAQHPYGFNELGTTHSLQTISREDLKQFWRTGYTPGNSALVVTGDLSGAELMALAQKYFGAWQGAAHAAVLPPLPAAATRKIILIDKPGSPQTALRIGEVGAPRSTPDYAALEVMNTAFGGIFSSRINLNLRETHGYTYGAGSGFAFNRGPGPFAIAAGVRTDVTAPAVHEIFAETERIRAQPIGADELAVARNAVARSLPGLFETTRIAARTVAGIFVYGLPLDYYGTLPPKIDAVTAQDVQRVAGEYLKPDQMTVVAVGDRRRIEPELEHLGLGAVQVQAIE